MVAAPAEGRRLQAAEGAHSRRPQGVEDGALFAGEAGDRQCGEVRSVGANRVADRVDAGRWVHPYEARQWDRAQRRVALAHHTPGACRQRAYAQTGGVAHRVGFDRVVECRFGAAGKLAARPAPLRCFERVEERLGEAIARIRIRVDDPNTDR
jgi:hypothetical protein